MRSIIVAITVIFCIAGYYFLIKRESQITNINWRSTESIINTSKSNYSRYEFKSVDASYQIFFSDDMQFTGGVNFYIKYGGDDFTKVVFDVSGRWHQKNGYIYIDLENTVVLSSKKLNPKLESFAKDYIEYLFRQTYRYHFYQGELVLTPMGFAGSVLVFSKT